MKIKLGEVLKAFDDTAIVGFDSKPLTVGKAIANILIAPRQGGAYEMDKIKLYILAQKCYNDKEIDMDESDLAKVKKMVETDANYGPLVTGKILLILEEQKAK